MNILLTGCARHANFTRAVARDVRVCLDSGDLSRLGIRGTGRQFGMQHPSVTGKAAASPRIWHDRFVRARTRHGQKVGVGPGSRARTRGVNDHVSQFFVNLHARKNRRGREVDRVNNVER
jgi:hypothetical protein